MLLDVHILLPLFRIILSFLIHINYQGLQPNSRHSTVHRMALRSLHEINARLQRVRTDFVVPSDVPDWWMLSRFEAAEHLSEKTVFYPIPVSRTQQTFSIVKMVRASWLGASVFVAKNQGLVEPVQSVITITTLSKVLTLWSLGPNYGNASEGSSGSTRRLYLSQGRTIAEGAASSISGFMFGICFGINFTVPPVSVAAEYAVGIAQ